MRRKLLLFTAICLILLSSCDFSDPVQIESGGKKISFRSLTVENLSNYWENDEPVTVQGDVIPLPYGAEIQITFPGEVPDRRVLVDEVYSAEGDRLFGRQSAKWLAGEFLSADGNILSFPVKENTSAGDAASYEEEQTFQRTYRLIYQEEPGQDFHVLEFMIIVEPLDVRTDSALFYGEEELEQGALMKEHFFEQRLDPQ